MASARSYDVLVIGSGPGGEGAAMTCAKAGKRVCMVEKDAVLGGSATHRGTIPSKALRHAIQELVKLQGSPWQRTSVVRELPRFVDLARTAHTVIDRQAAMRTQFYERNDVDIVHGGARFIDAHTVEVLEERGAHELLRADHVVIATGSRPYHPPGVDFAHPCIFDSDTVLGLDDTPRSMIVFGAGVIGCEYTSMFRALGVKLNLINTRPRLLEFLDDEISDALSYHLRDQGVVLRHDEELEHLETSEHGVLMHLKSGKKLKSDALLWANGRTGNTAGLGLEALGVMPDQRGCLKVSSSYQTTQPHLYAVGDVVGWPSLASASYDQGRFAGTHIVEGRAEGRLLAHMPTGIYTTPEISSVGKTERELTEHCVPYEVGHALFKHLARAQITGSTVGMLKLLFHRETLQLLGVHCFGDQAAEIVHIGQAIMSQPGAAASIAYFVNATFNYPTMAEAYRVAALNGINRVVR
ncbi:MAG: Si-specific NAD(P)(+) transhydrogenase [Deltaproteobacteria bacterium]|nr:Si-specific NAD(P)(+) transhydrogenase [Deltaproteobacteria bacterium]